MNAAASLPVDTDTLIALFSHLRDTGSELSLAEATALAIRDWLADDSRLANASQASPSGSARGYRGYQWKELFLPDGTDVRMRCDGDVHHARVCGDAIVFNGRRVSPRQLTIGIAGDGRNAWRDLSLRLPGEKHFEPASLLRHRVRANIKAAENQPPASPAATIAAAAASMSEALRTALQLVEHSTAQALPKYERRVETHRRAADVFTEYTAFD
ncbi:MAG: hypothetical protein JWP34_3373 [Massilia sp.]|jgi:hypothetical protein|nr:hypothetical protein [Massilia sp.]